MRRITLSFLFVLLFTVDVWATYVAVLETVAEDDVKELISPSDRHYLTNVLREMAVKQLPATLSYTIMTQENILEMLPPGKSLEDCEGGCLVETGKNIAADYICQARMGTFSGMLRLSAELYETASNKLIASLNVQGANLTEILQAVRKKSPGFFRSIMGGPADYVDEEVVDNTKKESKKFYAVEITTRMIGATPSIDGNVIPNCTETPCKTMVEEGRHNFSVSHKRFGVANIIVDVTENNQQVSISYDSYRGWLWVDPVFAGPAAAKGKLDIFVDGVHKAGPMIELNAGFHKVQVSHPCYDPVEFEVKIERNKTSVFSQSIPRGRGGLRLNAEFDGRPQKVAVFIEGLEVGKTPYRGEVPLCADVMLKGDGWEESVQAKFQWHKTILVTHQLANNPNKTSTDGDLTQSMTEPYVDLGGVENNMVGASIPAQVDTSVAVTKKDVRWVALALSATVTLTGGVLALVGNNIAKDAASRNTKFIDELKKNREDAEFGQSMRFVGICLTLVGAVGLGLSIAF